MNKLFFNDVSTLAIDKLECEHHRPDGWDQDISFFSPERWEKTDRGRQIIIFIHEIVPPFLSIFVSFLGLTQLHEGS